MKKNLAKRFSALLLSLLLLSGCGSFSTTTSELFSGFTSSSSPTSKEYTVMENTEMARQDFYTYVNQNWIDETPDPTYSPVVSSFSQTTAKTLGEVYQTLENHLEKGIDQQEDSAGKLTRFYATARNTSARTQAGMTPLLPYLNLVEHAEDLDALRLAAAEVDLAGFGNFVKFRISPDSKDSTINRLYLAGPMLGMKDKSYYETDDAQNSSAYIDAYKTCLQKLAMEAGKTEAEAARIVESGFAIEAELAASVLTNEEYNSSDQLYNKYTYKDFMSKNKQFGLDDFLTTLHLSNAASVIVLEVDYYKTLNALYVEENLEGLRAYVYLQTLFQSAKLLTPEASKVVQDYENTIYGTSGYRNDVNEALFLTRTYMGEQMGELYVKQYFSEDTKETVFQMVENILTTYKGRLENLDWMSEKTKAAAIKKLDSMEVKVGYPDAWSDLSALTISSPEDGGTVFQNAVNLYQYNYMDYCAAIDQPVDRSVWAMNAYETNAYYKNSSNEIVIPAGILQEPFFSPNYTDSQNYGAIGSIIAHEISHAFDSEGRKYDENGSISNWWSDKDLANYEAKTQALIEQYDAYQLYPDCYVNGNLTLNENIADLGGMTCISEVVGQLENGNYEEMFVSYATIYREKSTEIFAKRLLIEDNHAPNICRVNIILSNLDTYHEIFLTTEEDGMYRAPESRLQIW